MVIFNSYVSLPEGTWWFGISFFWTTSTHKNKDGTYWTSRRTSMISAYKSACEKHCYHCLSKYLSLCFMFKKINHTNIMYVYMNVPLCFFMFRQYLIDQTHVLKRGLCQARLKPYRASRRRHLSTWCVLLKWGIARGYLLLLALAL